MKFIIYLVLILLIPNLSNAKESPFYHIQPTKIIDGDTFHGTHENFPIKVRLYGIDAPEKGERIAKEATENLGIILENKESVAMELFYFNK